MKKHSTRRAFLTRLGLGAATLTMPGCATLGRVGGNRGTEQPNIVLMFIDDLGYGDIGPLGCKDIPTPNIDRLAREGTTCTSFHITNPPCSPSRHSLIMGEYGQRSGKYGMARGLALPDDRPTMARFLSDAGYQTAHIGKWDMGNMSQGPLKMGFKETCKTPPKKRYSESELAAIRGMGKAYARLPERNLRYICLNENGDEQLLIEYEGERIMEFLAREHEAPFFLYISPLAVHGPNIEMPKHLLDRVPQAVTGKRRYLAACITAVDDQVGQILAALDKQGLRDSTFFVLASDNGADPGEGGSSAPFAGGKGPGTQKEGWVRTPAIFSQPGVVPEGKVYDGTICSLDFYATFAALAGKRAPQNLDGVNLLPYLQGERKGDPHEYLFWLNSDPDDLNHRHVVAVRWKNWRLYKHEEADPWQLFDLQKDPKEEENVAAAFPRIVEKLSNAFDAWKESLPPWKPMPDPGKGIHVPKGHGWTSQA